MKMLHVTVQTARFEEELRFYEEIVELKIQRDMRGMGRNMAFLANGEGETCVEIIEVPESEDAGNEFLSIGFKTDDVDAKREALSAAGLKPSPMITPAPGVKFFFVKDPAGVKVQFI